MLAIAGQTAGSNGLKFIEGTYGFPGSKIGLKNLKIFFSSTPGTSARVSNNLNNNNFQLLIIVSTF